MSTCTDEADNAPLHMQEALSPVSSSSFPSSFFFYFDFKVCQPTVQLRIEPFASNTEFYLSSILELVERDYLPIDETVKNLIIGE